MALAEGGWVRRERAGFAAPPVALVVLAGLPVMAAAWALLSPDLVLSHEMTWDFLYNLSGAWQLQNGRAAHLDFHDPVGTLNFALTWLGFALVGPTPFAFLAGSVIFAIAVFLSAALAAMRRLPLLPAILFVVFASLLVLMPANVGDKPNAYSFAMSYNRYGWSLLSILAFILFVPPRHSSGEDRIDLVNAVAQLVALYYLKITYFAAGLAFLAVALVLFPHVRRHMAAWAVAIGLVLVNAFAPWNYGYLSDILQAANAGAVRNSLGFHLNNVFAHADGYAAYGAMLAIALWLHARGLAPARLPVAMAAVLTIGVLVLSQNHQSHGLPVGIVAAFLLYDQMRERQALAAPALLAAMTFALFAIGASAFSLAGYHSRAGHAELLRVIDHSQLTGLAVPLEQPGLLAAFADGGQTNHGLLNRARAGRPRFELSPAEYVETLLEAAALLQDGRHPPGAVVVLDQVNPLPFMLGWPPPRGGFLWSGPAAPILPAADVFDEADYVLIPKFSTYSAWTDRAQLEYSGYLTQNFRTRENTQSWVLLSRRDGAQPGSTERSERERVIVLPAVAPVR
jgi:hypothetical protein